MSIKQKVGVLFICTLVVQIGYAQSKVGCKDSATYENRNQVDPSLLTVTKLSGVAEDKDKVPIPDVCLGLFTGKEHKLVAQASTNADGYFRFGPVSPGHYRLVARYGTFCSSNTTIRVVSNAPKNKGAVRIVLHMMPAGTDLCSYGDYR